MSNACVRQLQSGAMIVALMALIGFAPESTMAAEALRCQAPYKQVAHDVSNVTTDRVEMFSNPETGESKGEIDGSTVAEGKIRCIATNLMVYVELPDSRAGWFFGDEVEYDQQFDLSSGCSKNEGQRVGATRGSGNCGG